MRRRSDVRLGLLGGMLSEMAALVGVLGSARVRRRRRNGCGDAHSAGFISAGVVGFDEGVMLGETGVGDDGTKLEDPGRPTRRLRNGRRSSSFVSFSVVVPPLFYNLL